MRNKTTAKATLDRVRAIAAKPSPEVYVTCGGTGRRPKRSSVYRQGIAILAHGEKVPVVIRNLSANGCRIEYFQKRRLEGQILITEPSLPLRLWGEVVWQAEGVSGVEFLADQLARSDDAAELGPG